jgi:hypothetical protein
MLSKFLCFFGFHSLKQKSAELKEEERTDWDILPGFKSIQKVIYYQVVKEKIYKCSRANCNYLKKIRKDC